ncbi:MAG: hypothetical protein HQL37_16585, partial [Alphaproteobacteria bacterium]|nr:hypothetical protein [Alphaproteobacteria bacterium]
AAGPVSEASHSWWEHLSDDIAVALNLSAGTIVFRNRTLHQGHFIAALQGSEVTFSQVSAELPMGGTVSAFGFAGIVNGQPQLDLTIEAADDNLRGELEWLGMNVGRIPADRLRKLALKTVIKGDGEPLRLPDLDVLLDGTRINGAATVLVRPRPGCVSAREAASPPPRSGNSRTRCHHKTGANRICSHDRLNLKSAGAARHFQWVRRQCAGARRNPHVSWCRYGGGGGGRRSAGRHGHLAQGHR